MADFKIIIIGLLTIFIAENLYAPVGQGKKLLEKQQLELETERWLDEEYRRLKLIKECKELLKKEKYRTGHNDGLNNFKKSFSHWSEFLIREKYMKPEYAIYENDNTMEVADKGGRPQIVGREGEGKEEEEDNTNGTTNLANEDKQKPIYREYNILLGYFYQLFRDHKIDLSSMKLPDPWCKKIQAKKVQTDLQIPFEILVEKCLKYVYMVLHIMEYEINTLTVPKVFQILYKMWSKQTLNYKNVVGELPQNLEPDELNGILLYFQEFGVGYYLYFRQIVNNLVLIAGRHGRFLSVNQFCDQPNLYENVKAIGESSTMTSNETNNAGEQRLKYEDKSLADQCIKFLENKKFGLGISEGLTNFKWSFSNLATNSIYEEYWNSSFAQYVNCNFTDVKISANDPEKNEKDNQKNDNTEQKGQELKPFGKNVIYVEYEILTSFFGRLFNDHKIDLTQMKLPRPWCKDIRAKQVITILHEKYAIDEEMDTLVNKCAENIYIVLDIANEEGEKAEMSTIFHMLYNFFSVDMLVYEYVFDEPSKDANPDELQIAQLYFREFFVQYYYYIKRIVDNLKGFQGKFTPVEEFCGRPDIYLKSTGYIEIQEMADV